MCVRTAGYVIDQQCQKEGGEACSLALLLAWRRLDDILNNTMVIVYIQQ
jgi:hypothetical protein